MSQRHAAQFCRNCTIGFNVAKSALTCFAEVLRWGSSVRSLEIKSIASEVTSLSVPAVRAASVWHWVRRSGSNAVITTVAQTKILKVNEGVVLTAHVLKHFYKKGKMECSANPTEQTIVGCLAKRGVRLFMVTSRPSTANTTLSISGGVD